ncbi:hypothetical protein M378DRAFT_171584, partial [Amanita muscaria Koide BX008]
RSLRVLCLAVNWTFKNVRIEGYNRRSFGVLPTFNIARFEGHARRSYFILSTLQNAFIKAFAWSNPTLALTFKDVLIEAFPALLYCQPLSIPLSRLSPGGAFCTVSRRCFPGEALLVLSTMKNAYTQILPCRALLHCVLLRTTVWDLWFCSSVLSTVKNACIRGFVLRALPLDC